MKIVLIILALCYSQAGIAQTSFLKEAFLKLDKALLDRDSVTLKQVLHKDLSYGHSNGWIESKQELIGHLFSGKLNYLRIENREMKWIVNKDWATVRFTSDVQYKLEGKTGELKMHVLQCWMKTNRGWQLMARQSTKI